VSAIRSLAINPDGFACDPTTGESYTLNPTAVTLLEGLRAGRPVADLVALLTERFDVGADEAARDVDDFLDHLRSFRLI
jgi:hypothetical protein